MMYKIGTLEEYLLENPEGTEENPSSKCRKWSNPNAEDEFLWHCETGTITEDEKFNIVSAWTRSIIKPEKTKYYIAEERHPGRVKSNNVLQSGAKKLEVFSSYVDWLDRCKFLGLEIDDIE